MGDESKILKILLLISGLMLCLAVLPIWPYGFYMVLRLVVCGVAIYVGIALRNHDSLNKHFIPLVFLAVLFNPLIPVSLTRVIWLPLNLGVAVYFLTLSKKI